MGKRYKSVRDMVSGVSEDEKFKEDTLNVLKERVLGKFLFSLRCAQKLTQKEMAEKFGCSQAKISKIESSRDEDLSFGDIVKFGRVLDLRLEINFRSKNAKYADMVKFHAFQIQRYLKLLAELAKDDEKIGKGVYEFHMETLINTNKFILDSAENLKKSTHNKGIKPAAGLVDVSGPIQQRDDTSAPTNSQPASSH